MVNKTIIVGRLTAKPTFDTSSTGTAYSRFTIAASRVSSDQADFIPCVAFRKTAELADQYLDKGSMVAIEGRINSSNYTNKEGKNVSRIEVVTDRLTFLDKKGSRNNNQSKDYSNSSKNDNTESKSESMNDFDDLDFVFE
ncbi:MAG: single-stranded DNA-binding protein [Mycoplasmataceae bacterium]|nr:single-stranded DNA-binding protein [Mycoplasmataceae bacterium]